MEIEIFWTYEDVNIEKNQTMGTGRLNKMKERGMTAMGLPGVSGEGIQGTGEKREDTYL